MIISWNDFLLSTFAIKNSENLVIDIEVSPPVSFVIREATVTLLLSIKKASL